MADTFIAAQEAARRTRLSTVRSHVESLRISSLRRDGDEARAAAGQVLAPLGSGAPAASRIQPTPRAHVERRH